MVYSLVPMDPRPTIRRKQARGRTATACLECQRRKKKCDRQWPCNHCQLRNISHHCHFGRPKTKSHLLEPQASSLDATRQATAPSIPDLDTSLSQEDYLLAVSELSYVDSNIFKVLQGNNEAQFMESCESLSIPDHVLQALRTVPPRPYTDNLVRNFFDCVNYHYCILHQPYFMIQYAEWWLKRRDLRSSSSSLNIAFTCLILRICSNSTQFLMPSDVARLESELGESISVLGANYNRAAQALSDFLPFGKGGLVNAQQLFLVATWYKGEGDFVSSWHQLAATIRHAQEIGIHNDSSPKQITEFEIELRRRLWCAACTWDRFMVVAFNRAPIIQGGESVPLPNPKLEESPDDGEIPSIVLAKVLENQLTSRFSDKNPQEISLDDKVALIENWMNTLPSVFRVEGAELRWDTSHPRLVFQRLQLHTAGYMAQLMLLRSAILDAEQSDLQKLSYTVDVSLKCMEVSRKLFDVCFPQQAKYFIIPFAPFDNASFLCSLIIKDGKAHKLPRRLEVIAAIGQALYMCNKLREFTKLATSTFRILMALTSNFTLETTERTLLEKTHEKGDASSAMSGDIIPLEPEPEEPSSHEVQSMPQLASVSEIDWEMWELPVPPLPQLGQVDLGVLDGVWDWNGLGLGEP